MSLLQELLTQTVKLGGSDLHLKFNQLPAVRINGRLSGLGRDRLVAENLEAFCDECIPTYLSQRWNDDHEVDFAHTVKGAGRFRVNVYQSQGQPCLTFRHVKTDIPNVSQINLPPIIGNLAMSERGIILAAGTTGSGKSTTLAAMINQINQNKVRRIITVEDPVEYLFTDAKSLISQREIGLDTLSFQASLRHVLRQDPDVIMIGEMRDAESFMAALAAADTGHLVFSTVHADNAAQTLTRILDFFPAEDREQMRVSLSVNLRAILAQRLVPGLQMGLMPAVEILINTSTVAKLIEKNRLGKLPTAIEVGTEDGMQSFNQAIYKLITSGAISEEEGMRYASNPETLAMNLKGIFLSEDRRILDSD